MIALDGELHSTHFSDSRHSNISWNSFKNWNFDIWRLFQRLRVLHFLNEKLNFSHTAESAQYCQKTFGNIRLPLYICFSRMNKDSGAIRHYCQRRNFYESSAVLEKIKKSKEISWKKVEDLKLTRIFFIIDGWIMWR